MSQDELVTLISENENTSDKSLINKKIKSLITRLAPDNSLEESYEIVLNYYKENRLTREYKIEQQGKTLIKRIDFHNEEL